MEKLKDVEEKRERRVEKLRSRLQSLKYERVNLENTARSGSKTDTEVVIKIAESMARSYGRGLVSLLSNE